MAGRGPVADELEESHVRSVEESLVLWKQLVDDEDDESLFAADLSM